jgi:hypothetical protein
MSVVSEVELAKALGRDRGAIRKAEAAGRITKRPDGMYDLEQAMQDFADTTHHEKGHNNRTPRAAKQPLQIDGHLPEIPSPEIPLPQDAKSTAYAKARAGTQIYEALLKKLRYEERAGNLVPAADVRNARFTEFRTLREACFNIPSRVSAILAAETSAEKCQALLEAELNSVFAAFAEGTTEAA